MSTHKKKMRLEGKACVVTGGGGGIGSATARQFIAEGSKGVIVSDIDFNAAKLVCEEINLDFSGNRAIPHKADVSLKKDVEESVDLCIRKFGSIDVYFANAGILGKYIPIIEESEESFMRALQVNTLGGFMAIKYASEGMKKNGGNGGSIIITSSIASIRADVTPLAYAASKGALLSLIVSANDRLLLDKIRVNGILPGGVMTNMAMGVAKDLDDQGLILQGYDMDRFPFFETSQIASCVTFLASDDSIPIKGQFIIADGGMSNSMGSQPPPTKKKVKKMAKL
jgi:NAD(P)-dependent dehydrogenase (short-subunit alcohol dehydrogenase family)